MNFSFSVRLLVVRKAPIETINHSKIDRFRPFTTNIHTRFAREASFKTWQHSPGKNVHLEFKNVRLSRDKGGRSTKKRGPALLAGRNPVRSNTTIPRNRPDTNICVRPGTRRPYSFIPTATFSRWPVQLNECCTRAREACNIERTAPLPLSGWMNKKNLPRGFFHQLSRGSSQKIAALSEEQLS